MSKKNSKSCKKETIIDILTGECVSLSKERGKLISNCQKKGDVYAYDPETAECVNTEDPGNVDIRRRLAKRNKRLIKVKKSVVPKDIQCYRLDGKESACGKVAFCSYIESTKKCALTESLTVLERSIEWVKDQVQKFPKTSLLLREMVREHTKLMEEVDQKKKTLVLMKLKYEKSKTYDEDYAKSLITLIKFKLERTTALEEWLLTSYDDSLDKEEEDREKEEDEMF